jgi:hypothetical protein
MTVKDLISQLEGMPPDAIVATGEPVRNGGATFMDTNEPACGIVIIAATRVRVPFKCDQTASSPSPEFSEQAA